MAEGKTITIIQKGKKALPTISISPTTLDIIRRECTSSPIGVGSNQSITITPSDTTLTWQMCTNFYLQFTDAPCCVCGEEDIDNCIDRCKIVMTPGNGEFPPDNLTYYHFVGQQTFYPLHYGEPSSHGTVDVRYLDYKNITAHGEVILHTTI